MLLRLCILVGHMSLDYSSLDTNPSLAGVETVSIYQCILVLARNMDADKSAVIEHYKDFYATYGTTSRQTEESPAGDRQHHIRVQ